MVRTLIALAAISTSLVLSACNTVQGAGKDVESVGKTGEEVINK